MGTENSGEEVKRVVTLPAELVEAAEIVVGIERQHDTATHTEIFSRIVTEGLEKVVHQRSRDRSWPGGNYRGEPGKRLRSRLQESLQSYRDSR